ncbi:MAG: hypothetical protein M0P52_16220 [Rhodoferax sp.]|nr:hypothetical protein [Rhodoferax sp.]
MHHQAPKEFPEPPKPFGMTSEHPKDAEQCCILFTTPEMRAGAVGRVVSELMDISDSSQGANQFAHGLCLKFPNVGSDPRIIAMIPENRIFIQAIHDQWPYWMHFLVPDQAQWSSLLLCLLRSLKVARGTGANAVASYDEAELADLMASMFGSMSIYHHHMQISDKKSKSILRVSVRAIELAMNMPGSLRDV